jgi:hydroxypyruvate isomerase
MRRREFLPAVAGLAAAASVPAQTVQRKGRIKQSVCRGVFKRGMALEDMCKEASRLGCKGIDLVGPKDWPLLKQYGLIPTMGSGFPGGSNIANGLNRKENHAGMVKSLHEAIDLAGANGVPNIICFSGNRAGMSDAEGMDNCVVALNQVKARAEDKGVTVNMELLNSKVNHPDYMCDHAAWGFEMCRRVDSPRVKVLYDIYHMQIMDGDIVRTIRDGIKWIGHFHTAGNPGRHEIDESNELNYRFIAQAILDTGYTGYVAHEYSPAQGRDWQQSLETALQIFDV